MLTDDALLNLLPGSLEMRRTDTETALERALVRHVRGVHDELVARGCCGRHGWYRVLYVTCVQCGTTSDMHALQGRRRKCRYAKDAVHVCLEPWEDGSR